jgi:hypothetical protein
MSAPATSQLATALAGIGIADKANASNRPNSPRRSCARPATLSQALTDCANTMARKLAETDPEDLDLGELAPRIVPLDLSEYGLRAARVAVHSAYAATTRAVQQAEIANQVILQREAEWHRALDFMRRYQAGIDIVRQLKFADSDKAVVKKDERIADRKRKRDEAAKVMDTRIVQIRTATASAVRK